MEKEENTTPITARIPLDLFAEIMSEIKDTNQTRSEFIKEAIEEKILNDNKEFMEAEIKCMEKKVEILKNKVKTFKKKKKNLNEPTAAEIDFLKQSLIILEENPHFIKGRISLYKNTFNKHMRLSEQEFWELMNRQ